MSEPRRCTTHLSTRRRRAFKGRVDCFRVHTAKMVLPRHGLLRSPLHRVPVLWSLYRPLLRSSRLGQLNLPLEHVSALQNYIRQRFKHGRHLTGVGKVRTSLVEAEQASSFCPFCPPTYSTDCTECAAAGPARDCPRVVHQGETGLHPRRPSRRSRIASAAPSTATGTETPPKTTSLPLDHARDSILPSDSSTPASTDRDHHDHL